MNQTPHPVLVIMGVSGVGKTTVGTELAERLRWSYQEGDDLHPQANVEKMRSGVPLDDADRAPWLDKVSGWIGRQCAAGSPGVITCSALTRRYRRTVIAGRAQVRLVYLKGDHELIAQRLAERKDHYMPSRLLQSQLETLEEPGEDENPITVNTDRPSHVIVTELIQRLERNRYHDL